MKEGFLYLFLSDMRRAYPRSSVYAALLRSIVSPSLHACALVRMCQCCPAWAFQLFRRLLIILHSIDVGRGFRIGPGLSLPHPVGIVIGGGVVIGEGASIFQGVTLGVANNHYPVIGNSVSIYPNAVVVGNVRVSAGAKIRALTFIGSSKEEILVEGR